MPKFWGQPLTPDYATLIAYTAAGLQEYIGEAHPRSKANEAKWRIQKLTYNASGLMTERRWADGTAEFDKTWDDGVTTYASYDYTP